jgi:hypothetical protein
MMLLIRNFIQLLTKPVFTVLFFLFTLSVFIFQARNYHFIYDDYYFLCVTLKHNYFESVKFLYLHMNGRWSSNLLTAFVFGTLGCRPHLYWYFQLTQFILFILAVSFFLRSLTEHLSEKKILFWQSLQIGAFFTCLYFWFYFDARIEIWYWEASCLVHQASLICIFLLYGTIFHPTLSKNIKLSIIILLSLFIGGSSESFAFACFIISIYLLIRTRKEKNSTAMLHILTAVFISISFCVLYFCPATAVRTGYLPEPEILTGLKNTAITFYLQLKKIKHLPFKALGIFLLWPLASMLKNYCQPNTIKYFTLNTFDYLIIAFLIFENSFLPAYSISQEAPDRTFAFTWLVGLLLMLNYLLKKEKTISS